MDDKPCGRLRGDAPRVVALVKTDLATRLMPQATCKFRAKPQSGTSWASIAPTGQICPGGWSESPQWVERIAPVGGANRPTTYGGGEAIRPAPPRPLGSPPQLARPHRAAAVTTGHGHRRRGPRPRKTSPWCAGTAEYSGLSVRASLPRSGLPASPAGLAGRQEAGWRSAGPWRP